MLPKRLSWKKKKQSTKENLKDSSTAQTLVQGEFPGSTNSEGTQFMPDPCYTRRTQSAPRIDVDEAGPDPVSPVARRHSSYTSTWAARMQSFCIPEIRRISATTAGAASQSRQSPGSTSVRRVSVIED